jgi:hypothetical protein
MKYRAYKLTVDLLNEQTKFRMACGSDREVFRATPLPPTLTGTQCFVRFAVPNPSKHFKVEKLF